MKFYITTPIYYVNSKPHLGHAYTTVVVDILARYHRIRNDKVFFLTGTDEHGAKIEITAQKQGKDPKEFCNEIAAQFKLSWDTLNISYDNFIRTTDSKHEEAVKKAAQILYDKGLIYRGKYEGYYCLDCEKHLTQKDLVDGKCPDHQKEPQYVSEDAWLFKLSVFKKELLRLIDKKELIIEPEERKNEVLGFLTTEDLKDIDISRRHVSWGIPLPWSPEETLYVWIDAFLNYLTGLHWDGNPKNIPEFWPPDLQLMAKDILRVHATIWPAMLLALDLPLPKKIFAHGFFTINKQKMSKSLGNVLDPLELSQQFGAEALRFLLVSAFPFGKDGDISQELFFEIYRDKLQNGIGNLVSRITSLAQNLDFSKDNLKISPKFTKIIDEVRKDYKKNMENLKINEAIDNIFTLIKFSDKIINDQKPWELELEKKKEVVYPLIETLRHISWLIYPFLPQTSEKMFNQLGLEKEMERKYSDFSLIGKTRFNKIKKGPILFPKII